MKLNLAAKHFGETHVLGEIHLSVAPGETVAIAGPSGVGKSTLLRIIAGLDTDFDGTITGVARPAIVFQEPTLLPWRTAADNIALVTGASPDRVAAHLDEVGLGASAHHFPRQMSLGQQRRLALARAFAADPDLLLLDEPFVSLDPDLVAEMLDLTERLLAGRAIATILVTHSVAEARRLASRRHVLEGRPASLRPLDP